MPGGAHDHMRSWSPEEDAMLLKMIQDGGNRWKHIAEALHTYQRTPAMVRNRYLRITNGRKLTKEGELHFPKSAPFRMAYICACFLLALCH